MSQSTTPLNTQLSPHASLAALVAHLKARGIFDEICSRVQIDQKTVKDSPQDKLLDILLTLLCGAQSLVQLNTLLRADPALQQAAGRTRAAEQSVAQQTLDAATAENVDQSQQADVQTRMRASLHFYDLRGGGVESSFGQDKSGLGITKRHKKRFQAQRLLMLLGTLAHNLLIWARRWLAQASPEHASRLQQYGIKRIIRDLAHISGILTFDAHGRLRSIALFSASSLTKLMLVPLRQLLAPSSIDVILDKT